MEGELSLARGRWTQLDSDWAGESGVGLVQLRFAVPSSSLADLPTPLFPFAVMRRQATINTMSLAFHALLFTADHCSSAATYQMLRRDRNPGHLYPRRRIYPSVALLPKPT